MKSSKQADGTQTRGKGSMSMQSDSKDIELKNGFPGVTRTFVPSLS
jgi:hypothetical protein